MANDQDTLDRSGAGQGSDPRVPIEHYVSRDWHEQEKRHLWSRVWQMACREEEIPNVGNYVTYDICDESVIVIRSSETEIKAFHNVCPHRGRTLTEGCGKTAKLHCKFHGWQWDLHGNNTKIIDRQDWGDTITDEDVRLKPVRVGTWSGWVYVSLAAEGETLEEQLAPASAILDPYRIQDMRYQWRKSTIMPCNWKTALEAFNEGYHVQTTHRQMLEYMDDVTVSFSHGRHGMFAYWEALPPGSRSRRLTGGDKTDDIRPGLKAYLEDMAETLNAGGSVQSVHAARRVAAEVPAGTNPLEVLMRYGQFIREHIDREGAEFPDMTPEQLRAGGTDWHLFPNQVVLQSPTGLLGYRARPNGDDPHSCIWDVYSLQRYGIGKAPENVQVEWSQDHADEGFWGKILCQDYANMGEVQKGMRSSALTVALTNPKQEVAVSNFHRALAEYIEDGRPDPT